MTFAQTECKTVVHISISPCCPALRLTLSLRWILFPWHVLLLAFLEFSDVLVSLQKWKNWFNIRCSSSSLKNIWWAQCTDMTWQCETKAFFKVCRQAERPSIWIRYIIFIACDTFLTCYDESDWTDHYRRAVSEIAEPTKAQVECWTHSQWQ